MPNDEYNNENEKKKKKPNRQQRRLYNQYVRKAMLSGDEVLSMQKWLAKKAKEAEE